MLLLLGLLISFMAVRNRKPGVTPAGIQLLYYRSYAERGRKWYIALMVWALLLLVS